MVTTVISDAAWGLPAYVKAAPEKVVPRSNPSLIRSGLLKTGAIAELNGDECKLSKVEWYERCWRDNIVDARENRLKV